jgi:hypothetical protein
VFRLQRPGNEDQLEIRSKAMDSAMTVMTAAAGLLFSVACAVLIEELFVGSFFRLFFSAQPDRNKVESL